MFIFFAAPVHVNNYDLCLFCIRNLFRSLEFIDEDFAWFFFLLLPTGIEYPEEESHYAKQQTARALIVSILFTFHSAKSPIYGCPD